MLNEGDKNQFAGFIDSYKRFSVFSGGKQIRGPDDQSLPPENVSFRLIGDSVTYKVEGLEALTNGNKEQLQREWRGQKEEVSQE